METALIQSDPAVMMGNPVVAGTRTTVELILVSPENPFRRLSPTRQSELTSEESRMKIPAGESVDNQIVEQLRKDGHEVDYIAESTPGI